MKITDLQWTPFDVPFRHQFATASRTLDSRAGVLLQLHTEEGIIGFGEASPLPVRGRNLLQSVLTICATLKPSLIGRQVEELTHLPNLHQAPANALAAVRCALDTAACDAQAQALGISVAEYLSPYAARSVVVNATIGSVATEVACQSARDARGADFTCIKLKVGMTGSVAEEAARVAAVREAIGPNLSLRLDANGAWNVAQAIRTIHALEPYNLELVEQPVPASDVLGLKRVREAVRAPIAADESITDYETARSIVEHGAAQVLVVKPMVIGGLRAAQRIIELANAAHVPVIVTTTIDTGIGNAAALHLAATLPPSSPACGVATSDLLATDLLTCPLTVSDGRMVLPSGPGLGISIDATALEQYRFVNSTSRG